MDKNSKSSEQILSILNKCRTFSITILLISLPYFIFLLLFPMFFNIDEGKLKIVKEYIDKVVLNLPFNFDLLVTPLVIVIAISVCGLLCGALSFYYQASRSAIVCIGTSAFFLTLYSFFYVMMSGWGM
jgi:hypothetical protein